MCLEQTNENDHRVKWSAGFAVCVAVYVQSAMPFAAETLYRLPYRLLSQKLVPKQ
jgi:hypothetical protein